MAGLRAASFETLRLSDVGRSFGGQVALSQLNIDIAQGEFIALLGPSGCGKSTALNCLAGLLPLTAGEIWIDEHRIDTLPSEKRDFGMVFQNYALFPHMSVFRNVAFGLQMRGVGKSEIRRRVGEALELVKLEEHAAKLPGQLSGGQQQRVAIARAVVIGARVVLMDEPLSNLDAKLRLEMRTEIRRLHQTLGLTTVYVTHDQEEALSLADRLVVLRLGRVQQIGTPTELYNHPANWHVADFMGYRNLIDLDVDRADGDAVSVSGQGISLAAHAVQPVAAGDRVRIAVRPHDLAVLDSAADSAAGGDPAAGENRIAAQVNVVEYQGREFVVEATTAQGLNLFVHTPRALSPGDPVTLTVPPARALAYHARLDEMSAEQAELAEVRA